MYNTYHLRTTQTLYSTMLALGEMLGAIKLTYKEFEDIVDEETGFVVGKTPIGEPIVSAVDGCWSYIGIIQTPTGEFEEINGFQVSVKTPLLNPEGSPYIHVNLRTKINLRERAEAMALENPELAEALSQIRNFFVVDAEGNPKAPSNPYQVFL